MSGPRQAGWFLPVCCSLRTGELLRCRPLSSRCAPLPLLLPRPPIPMCPQPTLEKSNKVAAANYSTPGTEAPQQYPTSAVRKAKDWSKVDQELAVGAGVAARGWGRAALCRVVLLWAYWEPC